MPINLPADFKNEPTEAAQAQRVAALKGSRLLFVSGSAQYGAMAGSIQASLRQARELGVEIWAVFQKNKENDNYYKMAKEGNTYDHEFFADMLDDKAAPNIVEALKETLKDLEPNFPTNKFFDGVWSPHESTQPVVGGIVDILHLPGNPQAAYMTARDKFQTRMALEKAQLNTAVAVAIWTVDDCAKAASKVGFPMIIKPTSGGGSQGVYKVDSEPELNDKVAQLLEECRNNWILSANPGMTNTAPILAETFIDPILYGGPDENLPYISEFDCDMLFWDGKCYYGNVIDNWLPEAPYFQDRGFNMPSITPENVQKELLEYCAKSVTALGFKQGSFHMEAWYTKTGPVLIECNPRVGGGSVSDLHHKCFGVDLSFNFFLSAMGIPINPPRSEKPVATRLFHLVNAHKTGTFTKVDYLDVCSEYASVTSAVPMKSAGAAVIGMDTGVPEWLAQIDTSSPDPSAVKDMCREMDEMVNKVIARASACTQGKDEPPRRKSSVAEIVVEMQVARRRMSRSSEVDEFGPAPGDERD